MSISSSLNSGVAGLSAQSTRLASISDNIANSSTYGYKRSETDFESLVINDSRSAAGKYTAGGVRAYTTRAISEQGDLVSTANSMDIAISGRGFLPVTASTSLNSLTDSKLMLTTTGSFSTDADGVLRTDTGLVLLGWAANADGTIPTKSRDTVTGLTPVIINANQTAGDPTTKITLGINLPSTQTEQDATIATLPTSVEYFDNLGSSQTLNFSFTAVAPVAPATSSNTWEMKVTDSDANDAVVASYTLSFSDDLANRGTIATVTAAADNPSTTSYDPATGALKLKVGAVGADAGEDMAISIGKPGDTNGLTQFAGAFSPTSISKDGSPVGNLSSIEIDKNGYIKATYDTGFIRTLYQIPLVDVPNPDGLTTLDSQAFAISSTSGSFYLWDAGTGPTGTVEGYAREGSAVDIAQELTNLIQTQRAYSSNAKVIQTVDEMLQETTNIKR
ncbi:MAG TPA: flagellar hook protein FlgE [Paenirhodobacter sp.]